MRRDMQAGSCRLREGACAFFHRRVIEGVEGFAEMQGIPSHFLLSTPLHLLCPLDVLLFLKSSLL